MKTNNTVNNDNYTFNNPIAASSLLLLTVMLVMISIVSSMVLAEGSDSPRIKVLLLNQDPQPAKAGDVVEVRLRFQNIGGSEQKNIWAKFVPDYPFSELVGDKKIQVIDSLPNWPDEENSKTLTFKIRVDREATAGQYKVSFQHTVNGGESWAWDEFTLDITTKEYAEIIYIDKTKLMPGKETELTFTINNIGNAPLQNIVFFWDEPNGVVLPVSTDNTRYIKFLAPGEHTALKYTVIASVNAEPALYKLNLNLQYDLKNSTGTSTKETIATKSGVFVGGETDFDVTFSESTQGQTSLSVANVGSNPALSVTVRVPAQQGFKVQGSTDAIVGNLDKGDYTIVSFQITPTAPRNSSDRVRNGSSGNGIGRLNGSGRGYGGNADSGSGSGDNSSSDNRALVDNRARFQNADPTVTDQGGNLRVLLEYTDTTGVRQTIEKIVPIQFRTATVGTSGQGGRGGSGATATSAWQSPIVLLSSAFIIVLAVVILYFRRKLSQLSKKV